MAEELETPLAEVTWWQRTNGFVRQKLTPLLFASSSTTTSMAQMVAGLVIIKWITPEELGLWQSVRLAQIYAFILLLGINNGLGRELPFLLGKGEDAFAGRLAGTAFFCVTMANIVIAIAGISCAIAFAERGAHLVCAILAITLQIGMVFYQHIFQLTFRSTDSFKKLTKIQFTEAALAILTVPLVYFFGYYGMLERTLLMTGVVCSLLYMNRPMRVKVRMDWHAFKLLLKTGLPIFGLDYLKNSCSTLDRVVLLNIGGVASVGIYALAGMVTQAVAALSGGIDTYVYPRMSYKYGQSGDGRVLWRFGMKFVFLSAGLSLIGATVAWVALPYFVPIFAPKYLAGLGAAQIVLISASIGGATIIVDALWSMKIWRLMVTFQVASALLFALGPILGVLFISKSVEGVAWGTVIGSVLRSMLAFGLTYYGTHKLDKPK
jgi:O-antigen/teichoic acid export membrane protein